MAKRYSPEVKSETDFYWGEENTFHSAVMVSDKNGKYIHIDSHLSTVCSLIKAQNKNRKYKDEIQQLKEEIKRLSK